jgi:hypothetical protein
MQRHRQVGESRPHQVAFVVRSSVTVPNRVSMRTCSSQATSEVLTYRFLRAGGRAPDLGRQAQGGRARA